jgi:hypothetical protein
MFVSYKSIQEKPARQFGLILLVLLVVIQAVQAVKGFFPNIPLLALTTFIVLALFHPPAVMKSVFWIVMLITGVIGTLLTVILLSLLFFLLVFTLGSFRRLMGRSPLDDSFDKEKKSYWIKINDFSTNMTKQS